MVLKYVDLKFKIFVNTEHERQNIRSMLNTSTENISKFRNTHKHLKEIMLKLRLTLYSVNFLDVFVVYFSLFIVMFFNNKIQANNEKKVKKK